jgi:hypothetical protein
MRLIRYIIQEQPFPSSPLVSSLDTVRRMMKPLPLIIAEDSHKQPAILDTMPRAHIGHRSCLLFAPLVLVSTPVG